MSHNVIAGELTLLYRQKHVLECKLRRMLQRNMALHDPSKPPQLKPLARRQSPPPPLPFISPGLSIVHYDRTIQRQWLQQVLLTLQPNAAQPPSKDWNAIMLVERGTNELRAIIFYTVDDVQCGHLLIRLTRADYNHVTQNDVQALLHKLIMKHGWLKHMHIVDGQENTLVPWIEAYGFQKDHWPVFNSFYMRAARGM